MTEMHKIAADPLLLFKPRLTGIYDASTVKAFHLLEEGKDKDLDELAALLDKEFAIHEKGFDEACKALSALEFKHRMDTNHVIVELGDTFNVDLYKELTGEYALRAKGKVIHFKTVADLSTSFETMKKAIAAGTPPSALFS
jgi:hypothetical protein